MLAAPRLEERLGGEADMVDDVLARQPLDPGDLVAQALDFLSSRHITSGSQPKTAFGDDDLEAGEALEDAVAEQADQVGLEDLAEAGVPLDVVGRLPRPRRWRSGRCPRRSSGGP